MDYDELYGKYTEKASQNPHYAHYPTIPNAWIYIAIDIRDMNMCKIGLTTKEDPLKRISEGRTYNHFLNYLQRINSQPVLGDARKKS
jgi:hypothetical protein